MPKIEDAKLWCRVQISGPGYSVTSEQALDDPDDRWMPIAEAIARAVGNECGRGRLLADIVFYLCDPECDMSTIEEVRPAEAAFSDAALGVIDAWENRFPQSG